MDLSKKIIPFGEKSWGRFDFRWVNSLIHTAPPCLCSVEIVGKWSWPFSSHSDFRTDSNSHATTIPISLAKHESEEALQAF